MHVNNSSSLRVRLCPSLYDINDEGFHVCRRRNISSHNTYLMVRSVQNIIAPMHILQYHVRVT
jgi:hypothetical protein